MDRKRILLVDDHPVITAGLSQMIGEEKDLAVCGVAADINAAMRLIAECAPHLVVVDITLKGSSGIDLIKFIRGRHPGVPTLVYSMHEESVYAERVFRAGARGFVMKDQPGEVLLAAIRKVLEGKLAFSDVVTTRMLDRYIESRPRESGAPLDCLTDREIEILGLVGRELKSAAIAERLGISVKTVEAHREHIRRKLDIPDSAELNRFAREWFDSRGHAEGSE